MMQFLDDLGLVVEMWGTDRHGPHRLNEHQGDVGYSCRHPDAGGVIMNRPKTSSSGGERENICGRKKFNSVPFGAGVTNNGALALSLSRVLSEGPDKLEIYF